jgi:AcrR family transcriptional regulator
MSRPVTISDDDILHAARALFTEKGPRATTAEIAARAGVSEGILFKRFGSKARLHKAAMSSAMIGSLIQREMRAQGPLRTQKDFLRFLHWHVGVMREVVPLIVMAWSSRSFTEELPADLTGESPPPLVAIRTFADMLEAEMKAGRLARRNADAVARIVLGAVWYFVFLELVLDKKRAGTDEDTFVGELARQVFSDLDPTREPAVAKRKKR